MSRRIIEYIRRHHVGLLALFVALGGTAAWAVDGPNPGQNTIGSEDIIGNEVKSDDIGNGRIFNLDIADEIITGAKIKEETLGMVPSAFAGGDVTEDTAGPCSLNDSTFVPCGEANTQLNGQTRPLVIATGTLVSGGGGSQSADCRINEGSTTFGGRRIFIPANGEIEEFTIVGQAPSFYAGNVDFELQCNSAGGGTLSLFRTSVIVLAASG